MKRHLTYSNVATTLALIIAIAGGTTAIAASQAPNNSVASSSIKPGNVTARDLAGVRVVQVSGIFKAFATCGKGEKLLGGGGDVSGGTSNVGASRPANNGWFVQQGATTGAPGDLPVSAYALCLRAKPHK